MLALNKDKTSPFYDSFVTIRGSTGASWSQSCTEDRRNPDDVRIVHFPGGDVGWDSKGGDHGRSCVRPVVVLELKHLILSYLQHAAHRHVRSYVTGEDSGPSSWRADTAIDTRWTSPDINQRGA
jgi:hypothetical protein